MNQQNEISELLSDITKAETRWHDAYIEAKKLAAMFNICSSLYSNQNAKNSEIKDKFKNFTTSISNANKIRSDVYTKAKKFAKKDEEVILDELCMIQQGLIIDINSEIGNQKCVECFKKANGNHEYLMKEEEFSIYIQQCHEKYRNIIKLKIQSLDTISFDNIKECLSQHNIKKYKKFVKKIQQDNKVLSSLPSIDLDETCDLIQTHFTLKKTL